MFVVSKIGSEYDFPPFFVLASDQLVVTGYFRSFLKTPDFAACVAQVLERLERFAGIVLASRDRLSNAGTAFGANHRPEPGGCISSAQGGVRGAALLRSGVGGQDGHGRGRCGHGIRRRRHTHHSCYGLCGWVSDGYGRYDGGGIRGGVIELGIIQQDGNVRHENCSEGSGQAVLRCRRFLNFCEAVPIEMV